MSKLQILNMANMSFNAIRENKFLKISELTCSMHPASILADIL